MHQKYIWLLSLILQEREFNLTGLTRLLLNIRVSGWGCCTSIHSMCSTHTSAFHYGILTYSIWIFQMFEEWHIWNVKPPSSTSCVAPETFQWCLCHRQNMRCSIRLALNWIHNSCILSQDSSLNVLFCLCVHEGFLLLNFYHLTQASAKGFVLIQTKEVSMRPEDVKRVFQNSAEDLVEWITKGTVLFFLWSFHFQLLRSVATFDRFYLTELFPARF